MKVTLPGQWRKLIPASLLSLGLLAGNEVRAQEPEANALKQKVQELVDEVVSAELEIEVPQKWQLGDTMYDSLLFIAAFLAVLIVEWFLRKRWGLV